MKIVDSKTTRLRYKELVCRIKTEIESHFVQEVGPYLPRETQITAILVTGERSWLVVVEDKSNPIKYWYISRLGDGTFRHSRNEWDSYGVAMSDGLLHMIFK